MATRLHSVKTPPLEVYCSVVARCMHYFKHIYASRLRNSGKAALASEFADVILNGGEITNGSSDDALRTMQLVYRIYCADSNWRSQYNLSCDTTERINEPN